MKISQQYLIKYFDNGVLNEKGRNQMIEDAKYLHESDWYTKWPVGDYYEYKNLFKIR